MNKNSFEVSHPPERKTAFSKKEQLDEIFANLNSQNDSYFENPGSSLTYSK